jgi:hypothetical protein
MPEQVKNPPRVREESGSNLGTDKNNSEPQSGVSHCMQANAGTGLGHGRFLSDYN